MSSPPTGPREARPDDRLRRVPITLLPPQKQARSRTCCKKSLMGPGHCLATLIRARAGLTLSRSRIIFHVLCSLRASSRDVSKMEQGAAPAGGGRTPLPGGAGAPPGGTMTPARSSLTAGLGLPEARQERLTRRRRDSEPEAGETDLKARPGAVRRRDGAPRGARILRKRMRHDGRLVRHSVLHPLGFCEGKSAPRRRGIRRPRAAKNRGDDARQFDFHARA